MKLVKFIHEDKGSIMLLEFVDDAAIVVGKEASKEIPAAPVVEEFLDFTEYVRSDDGAIMRETAPNWAVSTGRFRR